VAEKQAADKQAAERKAADKQAAERKAADKQAAERKAAEKVAAEKVALTSSAAPGDPQTLGSTLAARVRRLVPAGIIRFARPTVRRVRRWRYSR